jgi:excisionase family DNA binding protein
MTPVMSSPGAAAEACTDDRMKRRDDFRSGADTPTESAFLSRREVSRLFGVSPSTVTRWARIGLLKAARTRGGHYRFPAEETRRAADRGSDDDLSRQD